MTAASRGACSTPPRSCLEIQLATPDAPNGVYAIVADGEPREVYCDMHTDGGGWTLVAMSRRETLDDRAGPYHDELRSRRAESPHPWVWDGLRSIVAGRSDIRFTCHHSHTDLPRVDLSFYDVPWYREITTGTDAESCFNENDGEGFEPPAPARRDNVHDTFLPLGTPWAARYLEGEHRCGDEGGFCVDLRDRGIGGDVLDGTDWGEDDTQPKCGTDLSRDGIWGIYVREP